MMASRLWVCDTCHEPHEKMAWECPGCGKETCENCFWSFAHCKQCCEGKTDKELQVAAEEAGFDFAPAESGEE